MLGTLLAGLAGALLLAISVGSVELSVAEVWRALCGGGEPMHRLLIFELRLPRALVAVAVGGLLALAGALLQVLLRNPLADPYVLGVSGGAAVAALAALLAGLAAALVPLVAFAGALVSTILVFGLARGEGAWGTSRLLLTGVVLATGWSAVVTLLLASAPPGELPGMLYWLMGDLAAARRPLLPLTVLAACLLASLPMAPQLNILGRGEQVAASVGIRVGRLQTGVYLVSSLATGVAVAAGGSIGFVGLVVPHMLRLIVGNDQRVLLPAAALGGALLVLVADLVARTVVAPQQLPVGALTALLGVPVFLVLLRRRG